MNSRLLATKLHRPATPPKRVERPQLSQRLNEGLAAGRQITLVSAPPGFGKTTCISAWADTLDWTVAWLSLDAADDDPGRFLAYLVAALQGVEAGLGREIAGVLRAGQVPPGEAIWTTLVQEIAALETRFVLILDDFQAIQDRFVLQVVERLVAHLPPPLHLVLVTREDPPLPLGRLRANNQLTEIRAQDLRFSEGEAARFLSEVLGLSLRQADVEALAGKTEGWIAGLQLAGLSMQERANPADFVEALGGSHRFILSYLTEEVLSQQPEAIQQFLLQTSILDRLNGDLCDAVTGRSDGRALLARLFQANLFLIPLDDEGQWYRYHHLFGDLLRDLQGADKVETAELHRRASQWYAQAGGAGGGFASEAMGHALAAEDYGLAVGLLERYAADLIRQGYAQTVHGWVEAIPAEWASSSPRTNLALAWMHLLRGDYPQAAAYLARSGAAPEGGGAAAEAGEAARALGAEWLAMQSLMLNREGQAAASQAMARRAVEMAPAGDSRVRSLAYLGLASAYDPGEAYGLAVEAYQQAIQHGRAAEELVTEMVSTASLARLAFEHGQLRLAFEIAAPACARLAEGGALPPISTVVYGMLGEVYYQWHQVDEARQQVGRALQLSRLGGYPSGVIGCRLLLSRVSLAAGEVEAAAREIQEAADLLQGDTPDYVRQEAVAQQVRVYLARNRPAAAEMALQGEGFSFEAGFSYPDLPPGGRVSHAMGLLYNSSLGVVLHQARQRGDGAGLAAGIALAGRLIEGALAGRALLVALEALLLRAQMRAALGRDQAAGEADYGRALGLGEPEGCIAVFVEQGAPVAAALAKLVAARRLGRVERDYVAGILAAFGRGPAGAAGGGGPGGLVEPLTAREVEVLGLMAEGLTYKEMAERLFISLNTVRSHVKAIYGKLGVDKRVKAVEAARELGVL